MFEGNILCTMFSRKFCIFFWKDFFLKCRQSSSWFLSVASCNWCKVWQGLFWSFYQPYNYHYFHLLSKLKKKTSEFFSNDLVPVLPNDQIRNENLWIPFDLDNLSFLQFQKANMKILGNTEDSFFVKHLSYFQKSQTGKRRLLEITYDDVIEGSQIFWEVQWRWHLLLAILLLLGLIYVRHVSNRNRKPSWCFCFRGAAIYLTVVEWM